MQADVGHVFSHLQRRGLRGLVVHCLGGYLGLAINAAFYTGIQAGTAGSCGYDIASLGIP